MRVTVSLNLKLFSLWHLECPIFPINEVLYKQKDRVSMESPLGPTLANVFLSHYEKIQLERCPQEIKPLFYRRYVDDTFVLFEPQDELIKFQDDFNGCHPNMSFTHEVERDGKLSFLDVNVFCEEGQFLANVYRKPPLVRFIHILKVFCKELISLLCFIPLHIDVFKFVTIGQNSIRNSGFLKLSF